MYSRGTGRLLCTWARRLTTVGVLAAWGVTMSATESSAPFAHVAASGPAPLSSDGTWQPDLSVAGRSVHVDRPIPGIPPRAVRAYEFAEAVMRRADPSCNLDWTLLAAIGDVESDHGRYAGSALQPDGTSTTKILGPRLDGSAGLAAVPDTDGGEYDGDRQWDRAVGPMQFIPSTWSVAGSDADGDGTRDPDDLDDAALAAAAYLCAGNADLSTEADRRSALYRYNPSSSYVELVLRLADTYGGDVSASAGAPGVPVTHVVLPTLASPPDEAVHPPHTSFTPASPARSGHQPRQTSSPAATNGQREARRESLSTDAGNTDNTADGSGATRRTGGDGGSGNRTPTDANASSPTDEARTFAPDGTRAGDSGASGEPRTDDGTRRGGAQDGATADRSQSDGGEADGSEADGSDSGDEAGGDDGAGAGGETNDGETKDGAGNDGEPADEAASCTVDFAGVLDRAEDGTWTVDENPVDFGDDTYLHAEANHDFDGHDGVESNLKELETLLGAEVSVLVEEDTGVVHELDDLTYR